MSTETLTEPSAEAGLLGDVSADEPTEAQAPASTDVPHLADPAAAQPAAAAERPDWLPENFWNPERGEPNVQAMAKSYSDLRKMVSQGKHKPPPDGKYAAQGLPEDVAPALTEFASKWGLPQAAFEELAARTADIAQLNAAPTIDPATEKKLLGPNADAQINGMVNWARGLVNRGVWGPEDFDEFKVMGGTARGLKALMKMREAFEGRIPIETQPMEGAPTDDELRSMIGNVADPNNPYVKDAAYRAKVERLFAQRYGR
jgi:hypothetical protein